MINILVWAFCILACLVAVRLSLPIFDWYKSRHRDDKAEFLSDMYKIQQKWAKRGKYDFSEGIGMLTTAFTLKDEAPKAKTAYGREIQEALNELDKEKG